MTGLESPIGPGNRGIDPGSVTGPAEPGFAAQAKARPAGERRAYPRSAAAGAGAGSAAMAAAVAYARAVVVR